MTSSPELSPAIPGIASELSRPVPIEEDRSDSTTHNELSPGIAQSTYHPQQSSRSDPTTTAEPPEPEDWLTRMLNNPPRWEAWEPDVPICRCGVAMYAPDSQQAGACYLCRRGRGEVTP